MDANTRSIMHSSANEHWNTPEVIIRPLHARWGGVALDPCSNPRSSVGALQTFSGPSIDKDGLLESWQVSGLTFVNPPYGRKIRPWIQKCANEGMLAQKLQSGTEIILLGPARTDTKWFQEIVLPTATSVLLWSGRLTFDGVADPAPFPSFLAYWGHQPHLFKLAYIGKGWFIS